MRHLPIVLALGLIGAAIGVPAVAQAHFLWVGLRPGDGKESTACVWFNEEPAAGSARLAAKIAPTKAWLQLPGAAPAPLQLKLVKGDETGELAATTRAIKPLAIEARFEYGIFNHDGHSVLLEYYARHVAADKADALTALSTSDNLPMSIVPRIDGAGLTVDVLWQGRPTADCLVVIAGPGEENQELTSDAKGQVKLTSAKPGHYALRARRVDPTAGEKDGKPYEATHHYATLTFTLPANSPVAPVAESEQGTAEQVLANARGSRAVWDDFPGFTADLMLRQDDQHVQGRITITPDCEVRLSGFGDMKTDRAQRILESIVQHRSGGGGPLGAVTFVEEKAEHPLGRMIRFEDDKDLHSAYRVKDGVVTEVNRQMGPMRFTISVLDVYRNPENKYAPTTYNVTFWDKESGKLKASETHFNHWLRLNAFDLPSRITVLRVEDEKRGIVSMEFTGHRLLGTDASSAKN